AAGELLGGGRFLVNHAPERCDLFQTLAPLMLLVRRFGYDAQEDARRDWAGRVGLVFAGQILAQRLWTDTCAFGNLLDVMLNNARRCHQQPAACQNAGKVLLKLDDLRLTPRIELFSPSFSPSFHCRGSSFVMMTAA